MFKVTALRPAYGKQKELVYKATTLRPAKGKQKELVYKATFLRPAKGKQKEPLSDQPVIQMLTATQNSRTRFKQPFQVQDGLSRTLSDVLKIAKQPGILKHTPWMSLTSDPPPPPPPRKKQQHTSTTWHFKAHTLNVPNLWPPPPQKTATHLKNVW